RARGDSLIPVRAHALFVGARVEVPDGDQLRRLDGAATRSPRNTLSHNRVISVRLGAHSASSRRCSASVPPDRFQRAPVAHATVPSARRLSASARRTARSYSAPFPRGRLGPLVEHFTAGPDTRADAPEDPLPMRIRSTLAL